MTAFSRSFSCAAFALALGLPGFAAGADQAWTKDPSAWNVEIYPVYVWAPLMGASADLPQLPSLPNLPERPAGPSGNASSSLNGAAFFNFRVEKSKWGAEANLLWAGLSAERTNPNLKIKTDIIFGQVMGSREVLPSLWVEGGVRRVALNVGVRLSDYPEVTRKPGVTDPLFGVSYKRPLGKNWRLDLHADGGGFGVGSDVDYSATGRLDWRFAKHFGATVGWGLLHLKVSDTVLERTLTISQTLNGPILGLGIFF